MHLDDGYQVIVGLYGIPVRLDIVDEFVNVIFGVAKNIVIIGKTERGKNIDPPIRMDITPFLGWGYHGEKDKSDQE
jgi:hypothetical protein